MSGFQKYFFVINPASGHVRDHLEEYQNTIKLRYQGASLGLTREPGHATLLAREALARGQDHILVMGGDGTCNEVVQALVDYPDGVLGVLPGGSGNDFAAVLGQGVEMSRSSWDVLDQSEVRKIDLGLCNGRYFVNGVGVGYDAMVAEGVRKPSLFTGKLRYWKEILKHLLFYRENEIHVYWPEGEYRGPSFLVTSGIGRHYGGGFPLTPLAYADDGLLDVCLVRDIPVLSRFSKMLKLKRGRHLQEPEVTYFQTSELTIDLEKEVPAHIDGELLYAKKFSLKVLKKQLNVLYYPVGGHYFQE